MAKKEVTYKDEEYCVVLTLRSANGFDGLKHTALVTAQIPLTKFDEISNASEEEEVTEDFLIKAMTGIARAQNYPMCVCCVDVIHNDPNASTQFVVPKSFEAYMNLPEKLLDMWVECASELNPHWLPPAQEGTAKAVEEQQRGEESEPS